MTLSVAVIGSGISGLTAAHACRKAGWRVTLFEQEQVDGMAAHALPVDGGIVDVPLRVMGRHSWASVLALADELGVETFDVNVYVSLSRLNGKTWFRSSRMPLTRWPVVGSLRYLDQRALRLALGLLRLRQITGQARGDKLTLEQLLAGQSIDPLFWRGLVLPILKTICTCEEEYLLRWPAGQLLSLLHDILHRSDLLRLRGGTTALANALAGDTASHKGSPVSRVRLNQKSISVHNARGDGGRFDRVIVATQANQLGFLDGEPFAEERRVLSGIEYAQGELLVHRDRRFMPAREDDWTALNFQADESLDQSMFTVWVNAVEPTLAEKPPVFQTWNPIHQPEPDQVLARIPMQRAVVTGRTAGILQKLRRWHARPDRRLFYCGSWAFEGVPLLESGVQSALAVVRTVQDQLETQGQNANLRPISKLRSGPA